MKAIYVTLRLPIDDPTASPEDALLLGELIENLATSVVDVDRGEIVDRELTGIQKATVEIQGAKPVGEMVGCELLDE